MLDAVLHKTVGDIQEYVGRHRAISIAHGRPVLYRMQFKELFEFKNSDKMFLVFDHDKDGKVDFFEILAVLILGPPHTGTNYLLREFVHVVGRKHSQKLRLIGFSLGFALPILLLILPFHGLMLKHMMAAIAVLSHLAGVACTRWLFFAEAEHVVGLYYGKR